MSSIMGIFQSSLRNNHYAGCCLCFVPRIPSYVLHPLPQVLVQMVHINLENFGTNSIYAFSCLEREVAPHRICGTEVTSVVRLP